jgi:universal stress protein E
MNRIDNILVIVDPTATEQPAVDKAARLAQAFNARLELFLCDTQASREARLSAHVLNASASAAPFSAKALLESFAAPLRARGLDVTTETECADPLHAGLVDRTKRTSADLVVKDTHHHSVARRTFLTNTDWTLIRNCPAPLLLTKQTVWSTPPRIAVAIDPSHANDKPAALDHRILEQASALAQATGGELHAFHVYIPAAIIAAATVASAPLTVAITPEELEREEAEKRRQVRQLAREYGVIDAHVHLQAGGPGVVLPQMAHELHADILAMGAISRSGLKRMFLGSTAEDVLERLACDALIVKPPDFAAVLPF